MEQLPCVLECGPPAFLKESFPYFSVGWVILASSWESRRKDDDAEPQMTAVPRTRVLVGPPIHTAPVSSGVIVTSPARPSLVPCETR